MNILVTGGAGYIGSHVAKQLAKSGFSPVVFDSLVRGHREAVRWGPLETGDIRDEAGLDAVFRRHRPEAVLHFAALAYVGESMADPAPYFETNVGGTIQLLRVMRKHGVDRIVFSSSCATYGIPQALPITEDTPQNPMNHYGRSKLIGEQMLRAYSDAYGIRAAMLRYFNACGADPEGELGELHDPEPHLIPRVLMAAAGEIDHLQIFGDDYPTPDGTCVRDYIHVADLAAAHVAALQYLAGGGGTVALNLGTGKGLSVRQIVDAAMDVTGRPVPVQVCPRRPGDPPELVASGSLAERVLGVRPEYSDLRTILQTAWDWRLKSARLHPVASPQ
jgi:UDP-arabinose 4-epimerase